MSVRIGKIELFGVQNLYTEEARTLVEQRVPDQQGSVFQDLGREPVTIILEGLLFGDDALPTIESLRQAQAKAEALPFVADIVVGTDLTDVVLEDVRIRQLAGYKDRYRFVIRVREHLAPPEPANAGVAEVNASVAADADSWAGASLGAVAALDDPRALADVLSLSPDALEHLSMDDLAGSIAGKLTEMSGGDFSSILSAVSKIDPAKAMELVQAVRDADSLGDFLSKYADEGLDFLEDLTGVDLSTASALIKALSGGLEFLKKLKEVSDRATDLADEMQDFDPLAGLQPIISRLSS